MSKIYFEPVHKTPFYTKLVKWRDTKAKELKKPKYCVLNNKIIEDIILNAPKNNKELLKIKGIGPKKLELYGKCIFDILV